MPADLFASPKPRPLTPSPGRPACRRSVALGRMHHVRLRFATLLLTLVVLAGGLSVVGPETRAADEPAATADIELGEPVVQRWQVGAVVRATGGPVQALFITIPIPTDWPEQTVRLLDEDITTNVRSTTYRMLDDGVKQMVVTIPRVNPNEEVRALLTFEVTTHPILAPENTEQFSIPRRVPREHRKHLGNSPYINARHREIRKKARELVNDNMSAWKQVETFYDFVRSNISQETLPEKKGAITALRDGSGHSEDLVSLFVALCRAQDVPARTVWVQGHYYAEFYLEDEQGNGRWFPCQLIGNREFGSMSDVRVVMQKGDNIRVPEKDQPQRFVKELVKGKRSLGAPKVRFVRELLPDE